jgi:NADH-quinone oxidoreductase subunit J
MGWLENAIIVLFGLAAVAGALALVMQSDPVRAALGLLLSMASIGVIYLALGAHFVGFVQLIVYAGAIVILFLFAVMHFPLGKRRRDRIPGARLMGFVLIALLAVILLRDLALVAHFGIATVPVAARGYADALAIGRRFTSDWIYPFELISILLLVGVVAAVYLTRPASEGEGPKGGED